MGAPTLVDIARETKTSVSTVSRVLAGGAVAQRISRDTRTRVMAAAQKLGYRPNLLARSLRTRKTNTVAFLVSDIGNPFWGAICSLVEKSLHRHGYSLVLCNSAEDPDIERDYLELLPRKGVDGLILVPLAQQKEKIVGNFPPGFPLVILDRPVSGIGHCVSSDQDQGAGALCDALAKVGVKTVAIVAGPDYISTHRRRAEVVAQRFKVIAQHSGHAIFDTGRQAFLKFSDHDVDAVVCTNNFLAQGYIDAIESIEDPPVIGCFDEIPMSYLLPLPIVNSNQDIHALADNCVNQIIPQLKSEATEGKPIVLPMRVVTNRAFQKKFGK